MEKYSTRGEATWLAIREAAIELISTYGFKGFSLRELAARCNIKAGSLYNHIESKEDLLKTLLVDIMENLLHDFDNQVSPIVNPAEQMRAAVRLHIYFHTRRRAEVIIGNTELRNLSPENYKIITRLRNNYENKIRNIISKGISQGIFHVPDAKITSFAIIAMLTGVGYWYSPTGALDYHRLVEYHQQLIFQLLCVSATPDCTASGDS